jgi:hypothetical protein
MNIVGTKPLIVQPPGQSAQRKSTWLLLEQARLPARESDSKVRIRTLSSAGIEIDGSTKTGLAGLTRRLPSIQSTSLTALFYLLEFGTKKAGGFKVSKVKARAAQSAFTRYKLFLF